MTIKKLFVMLLFWGNFLFGQSGEISGLVKDNNNQPVIGANVIIENSLYGTATDSKGLYKFLNIPNGNYIVSVSVIGFSRVVSDTLTIKENKIELDFTLQPTSYQIDQLIVTANKFSQELKDVAAGSYILDQRIFSEKNIKQIDDALRFVPGVTMTSDQISIRGSSGYSRGAGTRVLVNIDGIPMYSPDAGDIVWEQIPISEIGRVEIIKGSASSLYGSSAIGGVVNILTKEISVNPVTYIKFQNGIYTNPSHTEWQWTDKTLTFNSQTISHSRSIGKLKLSGSFTRFEDYSYRKNDYQLRFAGFLKANYQFSSLTSLTLLGTGYTRDKQTFNYWKDLENALAPRDTDLGQTTDSDRTIIGMTLNHIFNDNFSIALIPSAYLSFWKDYSESKNKSNSKLLRTELKGNYRYSDNLTLVSGTEFAVSNVSSNIFGKRSSNSIGVYFQADYNPLENLNLSIGLRYDYSKLESLNSEQAVSPKFGITYELSESTFLRGLLAKGFRAPSLAEAFTSTTASGITIKPNPNIKAETSYSMEVGINHTFNKYLNIDLSLFNNEYYDMIEPGFLTPTEVLFSNLVRARIQGLDLAASYQPFSELILNAGYTLMLGNDLDLDKPLKYRSKHVLQMGLGYNKSFFQIGIDFRYLSRIESIDKEFVELGIIPDGDERVNIYVLDANAGINLFKYNIPARAFLRINNLLNYNYIELIGNIAPIRNISLNLEIIF